MRPSTSCFVSGRSCYKYHHSCTIVRVQNIVTAPQQYNVYKFDAHVCTPAPFHQRHCLMCMSYLAVIRSLEKLVVQRLHHRRASSDTFAVFDERIFSEKRWGCSRRLAAAGVRTKKRRFDVSMCKHGRAHFLHVCVCVCAAATQER